MNLNKIDKIILLVGLMGSGKTSVGKRLAKRLNLPFVDGDQEIEKAPAAALLLPNRHALWPNNTPLPFGSRPILIFSITARPDANTVRF